MSAHRTLNDAFRAFDTNGPGRLNDPGDAGTITVTMDRQICSVVTAGVETRILAQATKPGIFAAVALKTDGGDLTLTVTGGYNADGDTDIVYDDQGDMVLFYSIDVAGTCRWQAVAQEGTDVAVETDVIDNLTVSTKLIVSNGAYEVIGHTSQEVVSNGDGTTDLTPTLQVLGTTQDDASLLVGCFNTTDTVAPTLAFVKGGNAAIGSHTTVADNEYLGRIIAFGDDGTDLESPAAEIRFVVDDTPATGEMGGSIEFYTTADGGETLTHAMTITVGQQIVEGSGVVVTVSDGDGATNLIPGLQAVGVGAAFAEGSMLLATCSTTNTRAVAPHLAFVKGAAATQVATTPVADNEVVGVIAGYVSDGADFETPVASIEIVVDDAGGPGAGACGGSLEFYTTADASETLTLALTLDTAQGATFAGVATFDGNDMPTTEGAGITSHALVCEHSVVKVGDIIKTEILLDLTGLESTATDGDIIGDSGGGAAHIGQITAARNGTIICGRVTCFETPAGGDDDIAIYHATENTGVYDGAIGDLTETLNLDHAAWAGEEVDHLATVPAADSYIYLVAKGADTAGTYTAGILLIELWGK